TATIRVRVRPIGKFTLELRRRDESAPSLSEVAHDLVNVRHIPRHERRRVQAQARVDVGAPPGGDEAARPRRVPLETAYVVDIAPTVVQRVASSVAERGGHGGEDAIDQESRARPILERLDAPRAGAEDGDVAPGTGGPLPRWACAHTRPPPRRGRAPRPPRGAPPRRWPPPPAPPGARASRCWS